MITDMHLNEPHARKGFANRGGGFPLLETLKPNRRVALLPVGEMPAAGRGVQWAVVNKV
jgi:hypothetical protein